MNHARLRTRLSAAAVATCCRCVFSCPIKDLEVPRDREGNFHTQVFDRYSRYESQVAEGLTEMFVAGVSAQKVGDVAQTLMEVAPSASTVSRLNQTLTHQCRNVA